jgi:hypothetical protein
MITVDPAALSYEPIEVDPRPCALCGRTIDQHECFDDGEGPEFFCYPDDGLVTCWEIADPRDAWRRTGELPPPANVRNSDISARPADKPRPHRPAQSTVDAFRFLVALGDLQRLKSWLAARPKDAPFLLAMLESPVSC